MPGSQSGPEFPLTVTSHRDGDAWSFENEEELVEALPAFDSDDPSQAASVIDGRGRLVRLVVVNRQMTVLELASDFQAPPF